MNRLLISGRHEFISDFLNTKNIKFFQRFSCSGSQPPSQIDEDGKIFLASLNNLPPRVTRLSFRSRFITRKGLHQKQNNNEDNNPEPIILHKVPIMETREHVFPGFEKLMKKVEPLLSIISQVPPHTKNIALFATKDGVAPSPNLDHLYHLGILASYDTWPYSPKESPHVVLKSHSKLKLLKPVDGELSKISYADCQVIPDPPVTMTPELRILCYQVIDAVRRLLPFFRYHSVGENLNKSILDPLYWSYCAPDFTMPYETSRLQNILEEEDIMERLNKTNKILFEEHSFFTLASKMSQKLYESEMRERLLNSLTRLRNIVNHTLNTYQGTGNNESSEGSQHHATGAHKRGHSTSYEVKIRERIKNLILPQNVQNIINEELTRFATLDKNSAEFGMIQSYIDHVTLVPWGVYSSSNTTLKFAREILDEDHYGLDDVKDIILEHLAVVSRMEHKKGRILCFVGPPGVGKTSIAKSIARALKREYVRICVGGLDDVCEIKGHRRTYVGAMPGRIIKALQSAKTMDPVFCIDEIDKISNSWRGDPKSALLEVFDPEQNFNFLDHFIDVPCDLSRVLFLCTANSIKTINKPLLDRMEIVYLSGYTSEEKQQIVKNYIIPSIVKSFNISEIYGTKIKIDDVVIKRLTDEYFIEAGIRQTKSCLEKICRKSLKALEMQEAENVCVTLDNMHFYAGYPETPLRRPKIEEAVGIVSGLAAIGDNVEGFRLDIECDLLPSSCKSNKVSATGLAGKSLSESSMIAYHVAKRALISIDKENKALEHNDVRIHFLEGGQEKDGPSAGIAIFCAVLSQATGTPINRKLAMTGEITLKGNVMAVGGIKQKLSAAVRNGLSHVLLPGENSSQYETLPSSIKSKIEVTFVNNIDDIIDVVFPELINKDWKTNQEKTNQQTAK